METCMFSEIVKYLPIRDIVALCCTCKEYKLLYRETWLWNFLLKRDLNGYNIHSDYILNQELKILLKGTNGSNSHNEYITKTKIKTILSHSPDQIMTYLETPPFREYVLEKRFFSEQLLGKGSLLYDYDQKLFFKFIRTSMNIKTYPKEFSYRSHSHPLILFDFMCFCKIKTNHKLNSSFIMEEIKCMRGLLKEFYNSDIKEISQELYEKFLADRNYRDPEILKLAK